MENSIDNIANGLFFLAVFGTIYMLPAILAASRCMVDRWAIFFLNLLLGWTLAGWVGALCWAIAGTAKLRDVTPPPELVGFGDDRAR